MKYKLRLVIAISFVAITVAAFAAYLSHNRSLLTDLTRTSPLTVVILLLLYIVWFATMCAVVWISLRICKKTLTVKEGILLNGYSTLFNFFVPGQGGIAIRGAYLKKVKNLGIGTFIFVTLLYYMLYAMLSAGLLFVTNRPWWQTLGALLATAFVSLGVIYAYRRKRKTATTNLSLTAVNLGGLALVTILQSLVQVAIYAVELRSVNSHVALGQAITYTGAANFSLFVAITPGAIGIRESFLLFSRHLSRISVSTIVSASLLDRAVFIVFLGALFALTVGFHVTYKSLLHKPKAAMRVHNAA